MPILETRLDPRDATFVQNREAMTALVDDLRAKVAEVERGGGEAACANTSRGHEKYQHNASSVAAGLYLVPKVIE